MNPKLTVVLPYNTGSKSARALAAALDCTRWTRSSKFRWADKSVIWWGANSMVSLGQDDITRGFNPPWKLHGVIDKTGFFQTVGKSARVPEWTTSAKTAVDWARGGEVVIGRQTTSGHSGQGIVFFDDTKMEDFLRSKLFVKYIKNKYEFRIHVAFGKIIDRQRKALRSDAPKENADRRVRSHNNGFVYIREGIRVPMDVDAQALAAHKASGVDFGAYDVVYNEYYDKAYVLEVNSAPGLEGQTVESYATAFRENL